MVTVEHLVKSFAAPAGRGAPRARKPVLNGVSLRLNKGGVLAIIGPSGSGKSTLLRCLNLLEKPDSGKISIGSARLDCARYTRREERALRSQSAMVFQNYNLFRNKTALENVTEPLITAKKMRRAEAEEIGRALLARVGLSAEEKQYPVTLSGGQQQRAAIARALAVSPNVILFDEPTSALDPELVHEVLEVIMSLARENTTMIIVTHEMNFARAVSSRAVFLMNGSVVEEGESERLFASPSDERLKKFLYGAGNRSGAGAA